MKPIVSVCIFTYNHEKYIADCIESVLMQHTDFDFEVVIGEDYSTDSTRRICEKYLSNFPDKIRLLDRGKNLGICHNYFDTLQNCKSKYIAIIDGDDYWIDPLKLQLQYNYLEKNQDINLVFHQAIIINEIANSSLRFFVQNRKDFYSFSDILDKWIIATGTIFFRSESMVYPDFLLHTHNFDLAIQLLLTRNNNRVGYIDRTMSVYRINEGSNTNKVEYNILKTIDRQVLLFNEFDFYTKNRYKKEIANKVNSLMRIKNFFYFIKIKKTFKKIVKYPFNLLGLDVVKKRF